MTQFDQHDQHLDSQYNAGHDIIIQKRPLTFEEQQQRNNRTRMLERVKNLCIDGVLVPSLHNVAEIALQVKSDPAAIMIPMGDVLRDFDEARFLTLDVSSIISAYDSANGELLILGESGMGKSTLLLQILRVLLQRAQEDELHPIPVAFNLASWANTREPLATWMISQLYIKYQVPRDVAAAWVEADEILPLLDTLDEVIVEYRADCVEAINTYREAHGLLPTVVASRRTEYLALHTRLYLCACAVIQPLNSEQIEAYLDHGGANLIALRTRLHEDANLYALAQTPLILNVLALAYHDLARPEISIASRSTFEQQQAQVITAYVQRMLIRRDNVTTYTPQQTQHWLCVIAQQMRRTNATIFYLEQLQPTLLKKPRLLRAYDLYAIRIPGIVLGALVGFVISIILFTDLFPQFLTISILMGGWLGGVLSTESICHLVPAGKPKNIVYWWRLFHHFVAALGVGLCCGLSFERSDSLFLALNLGLACFLLQFLLARKIAPQPQMFPFVWRLFWQRIASKGVVRNGLLTLLFVQLSVGLSLGLNPKLSMVLANTLLSQLAVQHDIHRIVALNANLKETLRQGIGFGLTIALSTGLSASVISMLLLRKRAAIEQEGTFAWSWRSQISSLFSPSHVFMSMWIVVVIALVFGLSIMPNLGLTPALSIGLIKGLNFGIIYWLLLGIVHRMERKSIDETPNMQPNQSIRVSGLTGLVFGLIGSGVSALLILAGAALKADWRIGVNIEPFTAICVGPAVGLIVGSLSGGLVWLRHSILRRLLVREDKIPHDYERFLDYAVEHLLLRKFGGGYLFLHRLVLDYFADLEPEATTTTAHAS